MPFGDPRPLRRRPRPLSRKAGPGQKDSTASSRPSDRLSTPLKVALTVADAVEMCPRIVNPLEVRTGARRLDPHATDDGAAVIDLFNREDGQEYMVIVMRKPKPQPPDPSSKSTSSRS